MSSFICNGCRNVMWIPAKPRRKREKGHVKTMWCWRCRRKQPHKLMA